MKVKELIKLLEECNENLEIKASDDKENLGEVSGLYYRGSFYEIVVDHSRTLNLK